MYFGCHELVLGRPKNFRFIAWPDGRAFNDQPHLLVQAFSIIGSEIRSIHVKELKQ